MPDPLMLDPDYPEHPKVAQVGPLGLALHVSSIAYAARHRTDGYIPIGVVPLLVNLDGVAVEQTDRLTPTFEPALHRDLADALVHAGLWEQAPDGFLIHDYLDWQPSAREVRARAEPDDRRRGGLVRAARADRARGRFAPSSPGGPPGVPASSSDLGVVEGSPTASTSHNSGSTSLPVPTSSRAGLFAALASSTGADPTRMTPREARATGVALSGIRKAMPDVTPEEIHRRARMYGLHFPGTTLTAMALDKWWSRCASPPANGQGPRDRAREILEAARAHGQV